MKRGEVWWGSLPDPLGRRPVLVVQANSFNGSRIGSVIVCLITSNLGVAEAPGNVRLPEGEAGLSRPSVVNVSQVLTLDRARLTERIGRLSELSRQRVDAGLRLVLELPGGGAGGVMEAAAEYLVSGGAGGSKKGRIHLDTGIMMRDT